LEGLVLFVILWCYSRQPRRRMEVSAVFLVGYGLFRSAIEFVREPDTQIGYLLGGWLTMGQVLSAPMIIAGLLLFFLARRNKRETSI